MRLLVLIFAYFVKSSCRGVENSKTTLVPVDLNANWTSTSQKPGAETNVSSVYQSPCGNTSIETRSETLKLNSSMGNSLWNSSKVATNNVITTGNLSINGIISGSLSNQHHNQNSTLSNSAPLRAPHGPLKSTLSSENQIIDLINSTGGNEITHFSRSDVTKLDTSVRYDDQLKPISLSQRSKTDSANFISAEKKHMCCSISNPTRKNLKEVKKGEFELEFIPISDENNSSRDINSSVSNDSLIRTNINGIQENYRQTSNLTSDAIGQKAVGTQYQNLESPLNSENSTASSPKDSNPSRTESDEEDPRMPWIDVLTSPLLKKALKYFVTDYYPKKVLDKVDNIWKPSNLTKNGMQAQEMNVNLSVVYPLVMEGVSILLNRLSDDDSNINDQNDSDPVVKGQIVQGVIESLNKILKPKGLENRNTPGKSNLFTDVPKRFESGGLSKDILNSGTLNQLLPLVEKVPREDLQNTINGLMGIIASNSSNFQQISNASGVDLVKILSQPKILSVILPNGSKFSGLASFHNSSTLAEVLRKPSVLSSILGNRSNLSDLGHTTNIMNQFFPKNGDDKGISPKNPLLRSDFASKVLAKSPIAHLGALDENIKRLITNSLEKAVSRVRINEKGEIQINEGMHKILGKMVESEKSPGQNRTSDSLMDVLKSAISSGSVRVEPSRQPEDGKPIVRRNVTHHSHLHRKFQEKYGKFYQKSSVGLLGCSHFMLLVCPIIIAVFSS